MADEGEAGRELQAEAAEKVDRPIPERPPRPAPGGAGPASPAERLAVIDYIADLTVAFAGVARRRNMGTLAGLLDRAHRQARADASLARSAMAGGDGPAR